MEVLILGAGPAGTSCAIQLCRAGVGVTLIDHVDLPRFRPGESCHPGIEPLLRQLGVWHDIMLMNPARHRSVCINSNGDEKEEFFNAAEDWRGFHFEREKFDRLLLDKCIALGAKFLPCVRTLSFKTSGPVVVSALTSAGAFTFDYLVDATGTRSLTAARFKLHRQRYSGLIISHYTQLYTSLKLPGRLNAGFWITDDYWAYVACIRPGTYSVTSSCCDPAKFNEAFFIGEFFGNNYKVLISKGYETSWSIAGSHPFKNLYHVGDALMTFDPTSSKGILKSMMSGIYAAHILNNVKRAAITQSEGIEIYRHWGQAFFNRELAAVKTLIPKAMADKVFI